jgi:iron complex outermembrane receptor protein
MQARVLPAELPAPRGARRRSAMRRPVSVAIAFLVAGGAVPALAQDIRIDVTGSNIRRPEGEGALLVQIITREEIDRTGAQTAAELLQYVSANNSLGATTVTNVIGSPTNSVSTASLRGLGGQNTLVLLNGKRLTAALGEVQGFYGVNLDSIPFSAIERVDILKDGASAIYGSDAVAGVSTSSCARTSVAPRRRCTTARRRAAAVERSGRRRAPSASVT